jgi:exosortase
MIWHERHRIRAVKLAPNRIGLPLMVIGGALLCVGPPALDTYASVARLAFAFSLVGSILYLCGFTTLRLLAYPLLLLLMMFPLPGFVLERVTLPLQFLASSLAEHSLEWLGYSVLREGNILHLPGQTLSVAEACSGLRSLLALTFIAQAYVYLFDERPWMRLVIAVAVIPVAVIANSIRIVMSAIAGSYRKEWAEGYFHASTGWVMFAVAFLGIVVAHILAGKIHDAIRTRR